MNYKNSHDWLINELEENGWKNGNKENNFWKYAVPVFLVLAVIYFISRI